MDKAKAARAAGESLSLWCVMSVVALLGAWSCKSGPTEPSSPIGSPATYFVSTTGNDSNNGSIGAPFQTARAALARLQPGDTLFFRGGVYSGTANAIDPKFGPVPGGRSWSEPITIAGYGGEAVTLRPPSNVAAIGLTSPSQSYLIVKDLSVDMSNSGAGSDVDGIYMYRAHHIRLQRVEVMNSQTFGVHIGPETAFNEILNCRIHDNGIPGGPATNGHGLYVTGSDNLFENNEVYNNHGYGFHIYNNTGPHTDPSRNIVRNNRIYGNGRHGGTAYGLTVAWGDANRIESNDIYGNPGGIQIYTDASNTDVRNNTIRDNRPLEGILVQFARGTQLRNNTLNNNGTDLVDLGAATVIVQSAAGVLRPWRAPQP